MNTTAPNAVNAERAVLSELLKNFEHTPDLLFQLHRQDFTDSSHQAIFDEIKRQTEAALEVDPIVITQRLHAMETVADPEVVLDIAREEHSPRMLPSYIQLLKETAKLRHCKDVAMQIILRAGDQDTCAEEIAASAIDGLQDIAAATAQVRLITSYDEFMAQELADREEIACDACRGEVALIQSPTNHGKTSLTRNLSCSLAVGREFLPLTHEAEPRTVLLLNFEGAVGRFQADLQLMAQSFSGEEMDLVRSNLFPVQPTEWNRERFTLSRHLPLLRSHARHIKPDVIVIDTVTSGFDIRNENDNSEIQSIMKNLVELARSLNCLVILLHHMGKAKLEEGNTREPAHRGRGASAFADFASSIFNLEADADVPDLLHLQCAKRKNGENYEASLLLNRETRWYSYSEHEEPETDFQTFINVMQTFGHGHSVTRQEIQSAMPVPLTASKLTRCINKACESKLIRKIAHGRYEFIGNVHQPNSIKGEQMNISDLGQEL